MAASGPLDPAHTDGPTAEPDRAQLDQFFSAAYEELHRLASTVRGLGAGETLSPTVLVNETYLKLAASLPSTPESRLHFKRIAARAMRQVLVESSRRRGARKRGGGSIVVTLDEGRAGATTPEDILALDAALEELARVAPRQAEVIEYRFFGGYDIKETAALLGLSEATIARDWRAARAWLARELRRRR
jgi:RNA polymerase sigma factor (TIGR02999 family)